MKDITHEELLEDNDWLNAIISCMGNAVIVMDLKSKILLLNPEAQQVTGWTLEEAVGKKLSDVFSIRKDLSTEKENEVSKIDRFYNKGEFKEKTLHILLQKKNGEEIPIDYEISSLRKKEDVFGHVVVFRNVSVRREVEIKLHQRVKQIGLLQNIALAVNHADSIKEILQATLENVCQTTGWSVGHAYLFPKDRIHDDEMEPIWHFKDSQRFKDFKKIPESWKTAINILSDDKSGLGSSDCLIFDLQENPILPLNDDEGNRIQSAFGFPVRLSGEIKVILEFFALPSDPPEEEITNIMKLVTNLIGRAIERKNIEKELKRKNQQMSANLSLAAEFQQAILPCIPSMSFLKGSVTYIPVDEVSGDMYDMSPNRDGALNVFLGDASGHGIVAAFLAMMVQISLDSMRQDLSPHKVLSKLNTLLSMRDTGRYITGIFFRISPDGTLRVANAAHPPLIIVREKDEELILIKGAGCPMGLFTEECIPYSEEVFELKSGDKFFLFTDGLFEWQNPNGEEFGLDRVTFFLQNNRDLELDHTIKKLMAFLNDFVKSRKCDDDLTILGFQYLGDKR